MTNGRQPLSSRPRGTARGGVPDDELRTAWTAWLGTLRAHRLDPSPVLRPGAAPTLVTAAEQEIGHALPDDVRALYALGDGQESPAEVGGPLLFPAHAFCSLERGLVAWRHRDPGRAEWPLAEDEGGHLLVVDSEPDGQVGRIVAVGPDAGSRRDLAVGLVAYLGLLARAPLERPDSPDPAAWDVPSLR